MVWFDLVLYLYPVKLSYWVKLSELHTFSVKTPHVFHRKGLVYLEVGISDSDCISVPPLEGFVMNRVLGDYLESLMYKIFVSIDEHTPVAEVWRLVVACF